MPYWIVNNEHGRFTMNTQRCTTIITAMCIAAITLTTSPSDARIFFVDTPDEIQDALTEAGRNWQDDIIVILPGTYELQCPLVYLPDMNENFRLYIGGLTFGRPILDGQNSCAVMKMSNHWFRYYDTDDSDADILVTNLIFQNGVGGANSTSSHGGGLEIDTCHADITVENCLFRYNTTYCYGGAGFYIRATQTGNINIYNNILHDNTTPLSGAGGKIKLEHDASAWFVNNTVVDNVSSGPASVAGGLSVILNSNCTSQSYANVSGNIFWGNIAGDKGFDMAITMGHGCAARYDMEYNQISDWYILPVEAWHICMFNSNANPRLTMDYQLWPGSPCIDTGHVTRYFLDPLYDHFGNLRITDGNGDGRTEKDRGAYELPSTLSEYSILFEFIPDIPEDIELPHGLPHYMRIGDVAKNSDKRVGWTLSNHRTLYGNYCLYYGNAEFIDYSTKGMRNFGTATIDDVNLANSKSPVLIFFLYMDTEPGTDRDTLRIFANGYPVWQKDEQSVVMKEWQIVKIDLSKFAGQSVDLKIVFDTGDYLYNMTEGVYIDQMQVILR